MVEYIVIKDLGQDGHVFDTFEDSIKGYHDMTEYLLSDIPAINEDKVWVFKGVKLVIIPRIEVKDVIVDVEI